MENSATFVKIICEVSEWIAPQKSKFSLPDKDDLIYLNAALSANAQFLITGNIKDFPERKYKNCTILSPVEFLNTQN